MVQILLSIILIVFGRLTAGDPYTLIAGGWILITGILGVCSGVYFAKKPLVGVYISFSIITMIGGVSCTVLLLLLIIE